MGTPPTYSVPCHTPETETDRIDGGDHGRLCDKGVIYGALIAASQPAHTPTTGTASIAGYRATTSVAAGVFRNRDDKEHH